MSESPEERVLRSVGIPVSEALLKFVEGPDSGHFMDTFITDEIARTLWSTWNPDQLERIDRPVFREAFRQMVGEFVSLGLNAEHLRDVCRGLPEPGPDRRNWVNLFEEAVTGRDKCKLGISLDPGSYRECIKGPDQQGEHWGEMVSMMRDGLFYELGVVYPAVEVVPDELLQEREYRVEWNDLRLPPRRGIAKDRLMVSATVDAVSSLGIAAEPAINPANGQECAVVDIADKAACGNLTTWTWKGYIILGTSSVLRRAAGSFVNRYFVEYLLGMLRQVWPILIEQVNERIDRDLLVQVIRGLLTEEVSVRNLRAVLESMLDAQVAPEAPDTGRTIVSHPAIRPLYRTVAGRGQLMVADYIEYVRASMARYITHKYRSGAGTLTVYGLTPPAAKRLRQPADLTWTEAADLLQNVRELVADLPPDTRNPVILAESAVRSRLRRWVHWEFPHLAVVGQQEVLPGTTLRQIGKIDAGLEPYDESFYRLMDKVAALSGSAEDVPAPVWEGDLGEVLTVSRSRVVSLVAGTFEREQPHPMPDGALQQLVERYFDAYAEVLATGRSDRLKESLGTLAKALLVEGTRASHVLSLALSVHMRTREALAQEWRALGPEDALRRFQAWLANTEEIEHRVVEVCVGACRKTGSER